MYCLCYPTEPPEMTLKKLLTGWLLIAGMVLYASLLTVIHVGRTVVDALGSFAPGDTPSSSSP